MSDLISIASSMKHLDVSPQFANYSKVVIHVSDTLAVEAGDDTGRTLEIENPFGTQEMANDMLEKLRGFQYQPYDAQGAHLDPAAEIGDGANMRGIYGGIYTRSRKFGRLMTADMSAPHDDEINHEFEYESPQERKFERQVNDVRASLQIANDNIEAKVSQESPEGQTSFAWKMLSDSHKWYADGKEVMSITASGLKVSGEVEAETGKIGGFTISASAIYNNISEYGGAQTSGVYLGSDGIQLGQKFKVDPQGNVTATNLTVDTLRIGGSAVSAATLNSRANSAYTSTSSGGYCYTGAGYGNSYNRATQSSGGAPSYFYVGTLSASHMSGTSAYCGSLKIGNHSITKKSVSVDGDLIYYLAWL